MGTLTETLTQPVTPRDANGIARSTPKADRPAAKAAWATWVSSWKSYTYASGSDPGKFDHTGFTYSDEGGGGGGGFSGTTFAVTVQNAGGNKYFIDGVQQQFMYLEEGRSYRFDQSHGSNSNHPLRFSATSNGTHSGGSQYTTGVTTNGSPGNSGAYTQINVPSGAPTLYYYCAFHSGMGGTAYTPAAGLVEFNITVQNPGAGNRYYIDGNGPAPTISLEEGQTFRFNQSHNSNSNHPLRFSTTSNGTHGGGSQYTTGVTTNGSPGSSGAYTQITVANGAPTLYYYCAFHSNMGGQLNTPTPGA